MLYKRDLKPENFLYLTPADDSPLKVIDFGLSKIYGDPEIMVSPTKIGKKKKLSKVVMKTRAGTVKSLYFIYLNIEIFYFLW